MGTQVPHISEDIPHNKNMKVKNLIRDWEESVDNKNR